MNIIDFIAANFCEAEYMYSRRYYCIHLLSKTKASPASSLAPWMYSMLKAVALCTVNLLNPNCLLFNTLVKF